MRKEIREKLCGADGQYRTIIIKQFDITDMKKILLILLAFFALAGAQSQSWTVGVAVNALYVDYPDSIGVTHYCDSMSGYEARFHLPIPDVTGISLYVYVDQTTHASDSVILSQGANYMTMHIGDSMLVSNLSWPDTAIYMRYAGVESYFSVKFKAIGTPTVAGQPYACPSLIQGWFYQGIQCMFPNYADMTSICVTQNPSAIIDEYGNKHITVFPDPVLDVLNIETGRQNMPEEFQIIDMMGMKIQNGHLNDHTNKIDVSAMPAGIYFIKLLHSATIIKIVKL
jgi:hypothetical protein